MIEDVITGHDGLIRAVNIRTNSGRRTNRPISRLYPLEITNKTNAEPVNSDATDTQNKLDFESNQRNTSQPQDIHLTRQAAMKAHARVAEWTSVLCGPLEDVDDYL